jgi:single-strand DNA-binding protein
VNNNINVVLLSGNLTRDPELRFLPSGQGVCTFSIAVNRTYNSEAGEKKESVSFFRVVAWAKLGEICNEYLKKGSAVMVDGRLESRSWEGTDGVKKTTTEVIAAHVHFLSPKSTTSEPAKKEKNKKSSEFTDEELRPDDHFNPN